MNGSGGFENAGFEAAGFEATAGFGRTALKTATRTVDRIEALAWSYERGFSQGELSTIGLEEELILVDRDSLEPLDESGWVIEELADRRFAAEFRTAQIELVMPVSLTVADLCRELSKARAELVAVIEGRAHVLAAGTHPASARPIRVTDRPRYRQIARDHGWAVRRGLPSGLHVHVGVGDPDDALAVYNAARSFLPELAALSANSPFFEGVHTGLASTRLKLTEDLPRSGVPPVLGSWRELAELADWGSRAGAFAGLGYLWWDLRPRPDYGTIEFRIADAQTSVEATAAIAAVCQSLVAWLRTRFAAGEQLAVHPSHLIAENRWRAIRDGLDATVADLATAAIAPARVALAQLLLVLEPYAWELGCDAELALAWQFIAENGATVQRAVARERGVDGLVGWLVEQTERPADRLGRSSATLPPCAGQAPSS